MRCSFPADTKFPRTVRRAPFVAKFQFSGKLKQRQCGIIEQTSDFLPRTSKVSMTHCENGPAQWRHNMCQTSAVHIPQSSILESVTKVTLLVAQDFPCSVHRWSTALTHSRAGCPPAKGCRPGHRETASQELLPADKAAVGQHNGFQINHNLPGPASTCTTAHGCRTIIAAARSAITLGSPLQ